jgi:hypothetical protein
VVWSQIYTYEGTSVSAAVQTNSPLSGFIAVCLFREVWEPENEFGQSLGCFLVGLASTVSWTLACGLGVWVAEAQREGGLVQQRGLDAVTLPGFE